MQSHGASYRSEGTDLLTDHDAHDVAYYVRKQNTGTQPTISHTEDR